MCPSILSRLKISGKSQSKPSEADTYTSESGEQHPERRKKLGLRRLHDMMTVEGGDATAESAGEVAGEPETVDSDTDARVPVDG